MFNLVGSRTSSKQESCHLSLGTPMVSCSHDFVRLNLTNNLKKINLKRKSNYDDEEDLEKPTVLEMYMIRMKSEVWDSQCDFEMVQHQEGLVDMSLYEFAKTFYVRNKKSSET